MKYTFVSIVESVLNHFIIYLVAYLQLKFKLDTQLHICKSINL